MHGAFNVAGERNGLEKTIMPFRGRGSIHYPQWRQKSVELFLCSLDCVGQPTTGDLRLPYRGGAGYVRSRADTQLSVREQAGKAHAVGCGYGWKGKRPTTSPRWVHGVLKIPHSLSFD